MLASALLGCGGGPGGKGPAIALRQPSDTAVRTEGCIDTPFIAGDSRATSSGIQCGRAQASEGLQLRGRVVVEELGGLPGAGLEGLWVGVHVRGDRPLNLDAFPLAHAETETGPGGRFALLIEASGELMVAIRVEAGGRLLAARRVALQGPADPELSLLVPLDDGLRRELGLVAP